MFDEDPNDQANISGADLAQLVDELKAANQRNLELLAVIENIQSAFKFAVEMASEGDDSDIRNAHVKMLDALYAEPSQALREHEAKVLEEAADQLDDYFGVEKGNDTRSKALRDIANLRRRAEERRKKCTACDGTGDVHRADGEYLGQCPNCAKPFPAPKREDK